MNTEFPKSEKQFLKASLFQDQEIPLTYRGWSKKGNEDYVKDGKVVTTWKTKIKYTLRYSYPEYALDEAGDKIIKDGQPIKNRNWDEKFPKGYSILYHFDEGQLESGSLPLFSAFCLVRPKPGDVLTINRTGEGQETKWKVLRMKSGQIHATAGEVPEIDFNSPEYSGDPAVQNDSDEIPF